VEVKPGYKQTELGKIPEDWAVKPLAELFGFQNGVNADKSAYGHGVRFINVLEVITHFAITESQIPGKITLPAQAIKTFAVHRGDVLFNRTSETQEEVGLTSVYMGTQPVVFGGFVIRARPRDDSMAPGFTAYALRSPIVRSQIIGLGQGVVRANIGQRDLSRVRVPLPTKAEQEAIAEALGDADALIESLDQLLAKKRQIKQGAMQELLTGKKRLPGFTGAWDAVNLDSVIDRITGVWGASEPTPEHPRCVEVIRAGDISQEGRLAGSAQRFLSVPEFTRTSCRFDDIVMTTSGNGLGKTWWCDGRSNVTASNFVRILRPVQRKSTGRYLSYVLRSEAGLKQLQEHTATSAYPNLRPSFFLAAWISLPPISEQREIAVVLSDVDAEVAALEAKLDKARLIKQGMMQELLTGRIRLPVDSLGAVKAGAPH